MLNNSQEGVSADQCRFRLTSSQFIENRSGLKLTGGDGQLFLCRFSQNRESGAELTGGRIRINSSSFIQNSGVGILLDNARGSIIGSVLSDNRQVTCITVAVNLLSPCLTGGVVRMRNRY